MDETVTMINIKKQVDRGYLSDWYISSISEDIPPVWTDGHIDELLNDFILIPREAIND